MLCSPFCNLIILSKQIIFLSFPGSEIWQISKVHEIIYKVPYGSYIS